MVVEKENMQLFRTKLGLEIEKSLKENIENWIFDFGAIDRISAEFRGIIILLKYSSLVSYTLSLRRYQSWLSLSFFDQRAIKKTLESIKKTRKKDLEDQVLEILKK